MLKIPDKSLFPGTGAGGNGMSERLRSQGQWLAGIKTLGCGSCHQIGNKPTRQISKELGSFDSSYAAWMHRLQIGPAAEIMIRNIGELDTPNIIRNFADWTDRIAVGELPKSKPARPSGIERNVVITMWDWGSEKDGRSDMAASDTRNPTVNAGGAVFGVAEMTDSLTIVNPADNSSRTVKVPTTAPVLVST